MAVNNPSYHAWGSATDRQFQRNWERTQEKKAKKLTAEEEEQLQAQELLKHMVCDVEGHTWDPNSALCVNCGYNLVDSFLEGSTVANWSPWTPGAYTTPITTTWTTTTANIINSATWSTVTYPIIFSDPYANQSSSGQTIEFENWYTNI